MPCLWLTFNYLWMSNFQIYLVRSIVCYLATQFSLFVLLDLYYICLTFIIILQSIVSWYSSFEWLSPMIVTAYLENCASDFDDFFAQSYILMNLKNVPSRFLKKISFAPRDFWPKTPLCGWKMVFWAYIFETVHQILMIFSQMLDLLLMIWHKCYVLKNSSSLLGVFLPQKMLKIPPMRAIFLSCRILLKICTLSNLMVLNLFLMLFWPSFCNHLEAF